MVWLEQFFALLAGLARGLGRWCLNWWRIIHLGAVILVLALSPSSYSRQRWPVLATHVYQATAPVLLWFIALSALFGVVLIRIVVVTATGMGLSQYAVEMVVRVLVLVRVAKVAVVAVAVAVAVAEHAPPIPARTEAPLPPSAGSVPAYWPPLNRRSTSAQPLRSPRQAA